MLLFLVCSFIRYDTIRYSVAHTQPSAVCANGHYCSRAKDEEIYSKATVIVQSTQKACRFTAVARDLDDDLHDSVGLGRLWTAAGRRLVELPRA